MLELVEIRMTTYKRPEWLRYAINSLINQDYANWKAIVFDDSPLQEGRSVIDSFNDNRILYNPNNRNLGASENLNQCFDTNSLLGGVYAFVLEDDNWLYPNFISSNIEAIKKYNVSIVHRNQDVWDRSVDPPVKGLSTTLNHRYFRETMSPLQLHANILFFTGISNGALFFKTGIKSQLKITPTPVDPSIQEYLRCLSIVEDSIYLPEPQAAFAFVPANNTHRAYDKSKFFSAMIQACGRELFKRYGRDVMTECYEICVSKQYSKVQLQLLFANMFYFPFATYLVTPRYWFPFVKGLVKYVSFRGRVKSYFL